MSAVDPGHASAPAPTVAAGGPWLGSWRLLRAVGQVLGGIWQARRFAHDGDAARCAAIQRWSAGLLALLGIELRLRGQLQPGAQLIVANHVSWLDILAVHAVCPQARFVSKSDVRAWPLLGWLVGAAGTLFIERESKRDALRVVHQMAAALQAGDTLAVFPEGTTGSGHALLPFHANLLQAAVHAATPVQPLALRYAEHGHAVSPSAAYIGDDTLLQSLWRIACARGLSVQIEVLAPQASTDLDRRALSRLLSARIGAALAASAPCEASSAPTADACVPPR